MHRAVSLLRPHAQKQTGDRDVMNDAGSVACIYTHSSILESEIHARVYAGILISQGYSGEKKKGGVRLHKIS